MKTMDRKKIIVIFILLMATTNLPAGFNPSEQSIFNSKFDTYQIISLDAFNRHSLVSNHRDLIICGETIDSTTWLRYFQNDGNITYLYQTEVPISDMPIYTGRGQSISAADFDKDGLLDLAASASLYNRTPYFLGYFTNFGLANGFSTGHYDFEPDANKRVTEQIESCDFNNDTFPDLITAGLDKSLKTNRLRIYLNLQNGSFDPNAIELIKTKNSTFTFKFAIADFNNDGYWDIAATSSNNAFSLYLNNGLSGFNAGIPHDTGDPIYGSIKSVDYDMDGNIDIAIMGKIMLPSTNYEIRLYRNLGNGTFSSSQTTPEPDWGCRGSIAFSDSDHNGYPDMAVAGSYSNAKSTLRVYLNSLGTYDPAEIYPEPGLGVIAPGTVAWVDVDNDKDPDLCRAQKNTLAIMDSDYLPSFYFNTEITPNAPPSIPSGISCHVSGDKWTFTCAPSSDDHTGITGLQYYFYVDTNANAPFLTEAPLPVDPNGCMNIGNASLISGIPTHVVHQAKNRLSVRVRAYDSALIPSGASLTQTFSVPSISALHVPIPLSLTSARISWQNIANETSYTLFRNNLPSLSGSTRFGFPANQTNFDDSGLSSPGSIYYYFLRAYSDLGYSGTYGPVECQTLPPKSTTWSANATSPVTVQATIKKIASATSYTMFVNITTNTSTSVAKGGSTGPMTNILLSGLTPGVTNYLWIKSYSPIGTMGFSSRYGILMPPEAVAILSVIQIGSNSVSCTWNNLANETSYTLTCNSVVVKGTPINATNAVVSNLAPGTTNIFTVRGYNASGAGIPSAPFPHLMRPARPKFITIGTPPQNTVELRWKRISSATSYSLFRNTVLSTNTLTNIGGTGFPSTNFSDLAAAPHTTYYYWIRSYNGSGGSFLSSPTNIVTRPGKPVIHNVYPILTNQNAVSWRPIPTVTSYSLYRHTSADSNGSQKIGGITSPSTNFQDMTVSPNMRFYYWIKAFNQSGHSPVSDPVAVWSKPTPPHVFSAKSTLPQSVNLTWSNIPNATSYSLYRNISNATLSTTKLGGTLSPITVFSDYGILTDTPYYYWIKTFNPAGGSAYSTVRQVVTPVYPPILTECVPTSTNSISLKWQNIPNETGYTLYRSTIADFSSAMVLTWKDINITNFIDTGLASQTTYFYWIRVVTAGGSSPLSSFASNSTFSPFMAPVISNIELSQRIDFSGIVDIKFFAYDQNSDTCVIPIGEILYSTNSNTWLPLTRKTTNSFTLTPIPTQQNVEWNLSADLPMREKTNVFIKFRIRDAIDFSTLLSNTSPFRVDTLSPRGLHAITPRNNSSNRGSEAELSVTQVTDLSPVTYQFQIWKIHDSGNSISSGWIAQPRWKTENLLIDTGYAWRTASRDAFGNQSGWITNVFINLFAEVDHTKNKLVIAPNRISRLVKQDVRILVGGLNSTATHFEILVMDSSGVVIKNLGKIDATRLETGILWNLQNEYGQTVKPGLYFIIARDKSQYFIRKLFIQE